MSGARTAVRSATLVAVLAALTLVGCGGSGGGASDPADEAAVRDLARKVERYTSHGNAKGFCSLFEQERMKVWVGKKGCVKIFSRALKRQPDLGPLGIKEVKVDGDSATVSSDFGEMRFSRINGQWYLETPEPKAAPSSDG